MRNERTTGDTEAKARGGDGNPCRIHPDWFLLLACLLAAYGGGGLVLLAIWW